MVCFASAVTIDGPAPTGSTQTCSSTLTLAPGVYVFENGVTFGGCVTSGTSGGICGTTLDVYQGSFNLNSQTYFNLHAPTSGSTQGIVIMEPPGNTNPLNLQVGHSTGNVYGISGDIAGIIYTPDALLEFNDSGCDTLCGGLTLDADIIVKDFYDQTTAITINTYQDSGNAPSALRKITLVE